MKFSKKTIGNSLLLFFLLIFLWVPIASGKQSVIPAPAAKLVSDMGLGEIVYFLDQLDEKKRSILVEFLREYDDSESPILEYMRLSPDKYYLNVHNFDSNFIINFSEKFHKNWEIYVVKPHGKKLLSINNSNSQKNIQSANVSDYKADLKKIRIFLQKGWLSFQTEGHQESFISKVFYNSIQNENLPRGKIFETFGETSLPEKYHLTGNYLSNSWLISADFIKKNYPKKIIEGIEGGYEVGFIIEFSHKKLFIISLAVSGLFVLIVIVVNLFKVRNDSISLWFRGV
jgi:hypothetical protein